MRITIALFFVLFLAACNGSTTNNVPYTDPAVTAKLDALTQALAAATHAQAEETASLNKLTLIGKAHGVTDSIRMQGEFRTDAVSNGVSFGPCADMGVLVGFTSGGNNAADPLTASYQAFKQCTGYYYETQVETGALSVGARIFWDGPNCTGNEYEWEAGGAGYNTQTLQNGVVFLSPVDNSPLMVAAGQIPKPVMIQSVWVASNPGCQVDQETQLLYSVEPNNISITGVPVSVGSNFQLAAP